jgi:hypothetical protein
MTSLKFFRKDPTRDLMYAGVEGYQMDLSPIVKVAKNLGHEVELPSWAKLIQDPVKGRGWFTTLIEGLFRGKHNLRSLDTATLANIRGRRIAMMFFPDNTRVDNLDVIKGILAETLGGWTVRVLSGNTVDSNADCENEVAEVIESTTQNVLIISARMGQRSFSESRIGELYLAYDRGEDGATIQKISRVLTSITKDKVGKVFSLSFDPNRDDKLDTLVLQAALNQVDKNKGQTDIRKELKRVLNSIDIFSCKEVGAVKIDVDDFVETALAKKGITRVMGKKADLTRLSPLQIKALASGNVDYLRNEMKKVTETGKTHELTNDQKTLTNKTPKVKDVDLEKVREVIVTIIEHSDLFVYAGKNKGATNIREAIQIFENEGWQSMVEETFEVKFDVVKYLFTNDIIKTEWVDLLHS